MLGTNSATSSSSKDNSSLASVQPSGDPREDVKRALNALMAAKSWRARLTTNDGHVMNIEFVAPDRFHTKGASEDSPMSRGEMIIIGNDSFLNPGGAGWRKMPPTMNLAGQIKEFRHSDIVQEMLKYEDIKYLGPEKLDGAPMHVYQYRIKETSEAGVTIPAGVWKIWISAIDGLPRKNESQRETNNEGAPVKTKLNVVYSDYNSDIRIEPPV
jgi:hypothetical protein